MSASATDDLRRAVADVVWYHTIELPGGVITPGRWDTRSCVQRLPFPASLAGKRCLDVGAFDGFWAFEMEQRGSSEVVAIDLRDASSWDWPGGPRADMEQWESGVAGHAAFGVAHSALGSQVQRFELSVYDVSPERLGSFDFVFAGSLLAHLRDPVRALSALRSVVQGELLSGDMVSLGLSVLSPRRAAATLAGVDAPHWWTPNLAGRKRMLTAAGFVVKDAGGPYFLKHGSSAVRARDLRARVVGRLGVPHSWILAAPS